MKKLIIILFLSVIGRAGFSQELGIRLGDVVGNDAAVDGIFQMGEFNRIHADVSFGNGLGVEALYDFIFRPFGGKAEGLHWYVGAGGSMFLDDPFLLGISGEVGLEYRFAGAPIALGLDWRPIFFIVEDTDFYSDGFGFNARYVFGKK